MRDNIRNLAAAVMLQAVRDYFDWDATPEKRAVILKDLRSSWMRFLTDNMSVVVAEQLEKNPDEIRAIIKAEEECETL